MTVNAGSGWRNFQDSVRWAGLSQYHRRTLYQIVLLLEYIVDKKHASAPVKMLFVYQMQLAISSMSAWEDLETLVFQTCHKYPVSIFFVSGLQIIQLVYT